MADDSINGTIYRVSNRMNGKVYIGQTQRAFKSRIKQHLALAAKGSVKSALHKAINKYGVSAFCFMPIHVDIPTVSELNALESFYIELYKSFGSGGYNLTTGGESYIRSNETRQKMSLVNIGRPVSIETRKLISDKAKNRKHSAETKELMSKILIGNKRSDASIFSNLNEDRADKTVHEFMHPLHGVIKTFPADLAKRFNLRVSACHKLVAGEYKGTNGWSIKGNGPVVRCKVYKVINTVTGAVVVGTCSDLCKICDISIDSVYKLIAGKIKQTRQGWEFIKEVINE